MFEKWRKFCSLSILFFATRAFSSDFQFFDSGIDYWGEKKGKADVKVEEKKEPPPSPFDWKKHLDPKNTEFFKEGDYTPPEPFMELVRNPSDENIKNWFLLIEKKNELAARMQKRIEEYVARQEGSPGTRAILREKAAQVEKVSLDAKQYRFRFYFDSTCPHCKRMFETISELSARGYFVEAFQVDSRNVPLPGLPVPAAKASAEDLKKHNVQAVPLLLVGDLKKKIVLRLSGYQTVDSIMAAISGKNESPKPF